MSLTDIHSLSDFQRNARGHIRQIEASGNPAILTVNGQAKVVVQDVASYQNLLNRAQEADGLRRLQRGMADFHAGRAVDAETALDELEIRHFGKAVSRRSPKLRSPARAKPRKK